MERKQACIDESTEFLCPTCGTSAFEVVGTQWGCGDTDTTGEFLVLRCLDCLELFYHQLRPQEACAADEREEKINLVTEILGPLPKGLSNSTS